MKARYTGTMIEDLIDAVAHAEEQARTQAPAPLAVRVAPAPPPAPRPELFRAQVDCGVGQMVGVA